MTRDHQHQLIYDRTVGLCRYNVDAAFYYSAM